MNIQDTRLNHILQQIETRGSVNVVELARTLAVSEMTIRRDLIALEKAGLVRRVHGGAVSGRGRNYEPPLYLRSEENKDEKARLGRYAADMVAEGDSISLDVGSTVFEIAKNLVKRKNLTVLTPSFHVAGLLLQQPDVRVILTGGIMRPTEASLIGDLARKTIENIFVDRLFVGVGGIDIKAGFTEYNLDDTLIKQAMMRNAKEVIVVADSTKFQKTAFALIGPLQSAQHLVTGEIPPPDLLKCLQEVGVTVHVAPAEGEPQVFS